MAKEAKPLSEADLAYQILKQVQSVMYFRDLINKVLETKGGRVYSLAQAMAEVHTQINMDSRFIHMGKGMWGLAEWTPQRNGPRVGEDTPVVINANANFRREKLLEEIQQSYIEVAAETEEVEESP